MEKVEGIISLNLAFDTEIPYKVGISAKGELNYLAHCKTHFEPLLMYTNRHL